MLLVFESRISSPKKNVLIVFFVIVVPSFNPCKIFWFASILFDFGIGVLKSGIWTNKMLKLYDWLSWHAFLLDIIQVYVNCIVKVRKFRKHTQYYIATVLVARNLTGQGWFSSEPLI
jgi:hypothetical protein